MKAVVLYRPNTENSRSIEEYAHDFERQQGKKLELVSLDTKEGSDLAQLYDIPQQPVILVIRDDGQLVNNWQGTPLPLMNEVAAYLAV